MPVSYPQAEARQQPNTANGTDKTDLWELLCTHRGGQQGSFHSQILSLTFLSSVPHSSHGSTKEVALVSQQASPPALVQQHEL